MQFNWNLDVAAIAVLLIVILIYLQQNYVKNFTHYLFIALWTVSFFTPIADIISVAAMTNGWGWAFLISNQAYYLGQQFTGYIFFLYALSPILRKEGIPRIKYILFTIPIVFAIAFVLLNPVFHHLYSYDFSTNTYSYGPMQAVCYIPAMFYYVYAVYYTHKRRDIYNVHVRHAIHNSVVLIFISLMFSVFKPNVLTRSFVVSLAIIQLLIISRDQHAQVDPETGLLDGNAFYDLVRSLIFNKVPFNVLLIRVADYEVVLSTYGLTNLQELSRQICLSLQPFIPKYRGFNLHEDVIVIIYEKQSEADRKRVERDVDDMMQQKWTINDVDISFSHFVSTFRFPTDFKTEQDLMSLIIFIRKTRRMRYGIINVEEFAIRDLHRESDVEKALVHALKHNEFEMYYQPICLAENQRFVTAEALIRLNNSILGPIGPGEFIPIAEKSGLVVSIGYYVLESVIRFISEHDLKAWGVEYIEVNLSTIQCLQRNFIDTLLSLTEKYQVKPSSICFEITETASNCSPEIFAHNLQTLHNFGYRLAIDDFGTGYGNLTRLISMDFDIVKFDKNTTEQICTDEKIRPLFGRMVKMIHSLGCTVVAEGIETKEQFEFLSGIDTDYIQGYYFSMPLPEEEYIDFMNEKTRQ